MSTAKQEPPSTRLVDEPAPFDWFLEAAAIIALIYLWAFTVTIFSRLPEEIPMRFDAVGTPTDWGSKSTIFGLPAVATFCFILLSVIPKFTKKFNYPFKITPQNELIQYQYALRLLRVLKVIILIVFITLAHYIYYAVTTPQPVQHMWLLPLIFILIFVPIGLYLFHAWKAR